MKPKRNQPQNPGNLYYNNLERWGKPIDQANQIRIERTISLIPPDINTVLDAGCGDGSLTNTLALRGLNVTGIDISMSALHYVEVNKCNAALEVLPFQDRSFDLVIGAEVLEHLPEDVYGQVISELKRVAKKYILITNPNDEHLPTSFSQCENCGCIFHINYHTRKLNLTGHKELFRNFSLINTIEIGSWHQNPLLTNIQHLLGIYRFTPGIICPLCHNSSSHKPHLRLPSRIAWKITRLLIYSLPKRPKARWIASLFQSTE